MNLKVVQEFKDDLDTICGNNVLSIDINSVTTQEFSEDTLKG